MDNIENELLMLEKYRLTPEEWLVTRLLILASVDEGHPEYLKRYLGFSDLKLRDTLKSLQNKSVILHSYKIPESGQVFDPEDVDLNSNFLRNFYKCSGTMGQELFEPYPYQIVSNGGVRYILNNIAKSYDSLEDLYYDYGKSIKFNPDTHKKVMKLLGFAKEHNLITFGICEWVKSRKWLTIEKMKKDGSYLETVTDNIESI